MNKAVIENLMLASHYKNEAIKALVPESGKARFENIQKEMKNLLKVIFYEGTTGPESQEKTADSSGTKKVEVE
jgi:molybdopterin biosynthesis enzyme MoaB